MGKADNKLKWWQLSILGVGFVIGTGFFLGSTIAIQSAGLMVLIPFLLAALGTYIIYDALSRMTAADPQQGSFSYYSNKAYGRWAGFSSGWVYWSSEMLIMGSQMIGISIFTKFWFPNLPLWIFSTIYMVLAIIIVLIGIKWFERFGNLFAIAKLAAIIIFITLALMAIFGVFGKSAELHYPRNFSSAFPNGLTGLWAALLYSFYAYGGIEIMSIYATRLKDPKEAPKSGKFMLLMLTIIYVISIGLAIILVPLKAFNMKESPFVVALEHFHLGFVPHLFNGIMIIAGFSTMTASLFAVTTMIVNLAKSGNAPRIFQKESKWTLPPPALILTIAGLATSILMGLLLPNKVYEYITTAAGLLLLYNWLFVLYAAKKLLPLTKLDHFKRYVGVLLILFAVTGTLFHSSSRPGFFISLGFLVIIAIVAWRINKSIDQQETDVNQHGSLFIKLKWQE